MYQAKERRQGPRRALLRRDPRPPAAPDRARAAPPRTALEQRRSSRSITSRRSTSPTRPPGRRRGARALERGLARRVHPGGRGDRADRPARRVRARAPRPATRRWHAQGLTPLTVTVNVSTRQLEDPDFPIVVAHRARRRRPRARVPVPRDHRVRADGRAGTRRSRLPADAQGARRLRRHRRLRHRPLVARPPASAPGRGRSRSTARSSTASAPSPRTPRSSPPILSLAHALGLHVVAEGVETPLQAHQLIALGCARRAGLAVVARRARRRRSPRRRSSAPRAHPRRRRPPRRAQPGR